MPLLLVRHAEAVSRSNWTGPDRDRPLSSAGHFQAASLAATLEKYAPARLLSSPYERCMQTFEPLAATLGLSVQPTKALEEQRGYEALELLRGLAGGDVALCTHGDVIPEILQALAVEDGLDLGPLPRHGKGSTWVLETAGPRFIGATYLEPPR